MELGSLQEDLLSLLWAADSLHAGASLGSAVLCRLGCNGHVPLLCSRLDPSSSMRRGRGTACQVFGAGGRGGAVATSSFR